jgi:hypothetical protein
MRVSLRDFPPLAPLRTVLKSSQLFRLSELLFEKTVRI